MKGESLINYQYACNLENLKASNGQELTQQKTMADDAAERKEGTGCKIEFRLVQQDAISQFSAVVHPASLVLKCQHRRHYDQQWRYELDNVKLL